MISGYEDFAIKVIDNDIEIINLIVRALEVRIGDSNAITNKSMRAGLYNKAGYNICDRKMRKYIQYIRAYNLISMLCSSGKGYWVAKDKEEFIKSREAFRMRVRSMSFTLACMDLDEVTNNVIK